jgi:hypothetical protein
VHPHSTVRFFEELHNLPEAAQAAVLAKLAELPEANLFAQALGAYWEHHRG